jgi:poly(A) polymerase
MDWLTFPAVMKVSQILGVGNARVVGGAVRDRLFGQSAHDVDIATPLPPAKVMALLREANIKAIPTGIAHGTVTAAFTDGPVEITTLRSDVTTDGRRATVAFTDDWREDAARRDFTINALYSDPFTGEIFDYFGGREDISAGIVRFIGEPLERIAEDHLRILRFFRFHARFGAGEADADSLSACAARANDLMALSRERIADELLKLLALPDPLATVQLMLDHGVFAPILPEITTTSHLAKLNGADPVRRLASLLPADTKIADSVAKRFKLSKAITKRLVRAAERNPADAVHPKALAYWQGMEAAEDRLLLSGDVDALATMAGWNIPQFPITGSFIIKRGIPAGPNVALILKAVEAQWVAEGFPDVARVGTIVDGLIAKG